MRRKWSEKRIQRTRHFYDVSQKKHVRSGSRVAAAYTTRVSDLGYKRLQEFTAKIVMRYSELHDCNVTAMTMHTHRPTSR